MIEFITVTYIVRYAWKNNLIDNLKKKIKNNAILIYLLNINQGDFVIMTAKSENSEMQKIKGWPKITAIPNNLTIQQYDIKADAQNKTGHTLLIETVAMRNVKIVKMLLNWKDVQVNACTRRYETALSLAARSQHVKVVKLLLNKKNINVNFLAKSVATSLFDAISHKFLEIAQLLLKQTDIETKGQSSARALLYAAKNRQIKIIRLITYF